MAMERKQKTMTGHRLNFPFSAIVGQEDLKTALLLCAVDPAAGGLLVRGEKGTAKSTAVRSLAAVITNDSNAYSRTRRVPVIELPLNTTEDRLCGGIDLELTARSGKLTFQPGLLAAAHGGFLYVDEVNLLDDRLVDIILDAAASGVVHVEREGISYTHPARFVLVGTMNPEEGELRPQLLDRFGLCVDVGGLTDPEHRVELMRRRETYDLDPARFVSQWSEEEKRISEQITTAQNVLLTVTVSNSIRTTIATRCVEAHCAGHRAELILERCARALAALRGLQKIDNHCIDDASRYVFLHRRRERQNSHHPPSQPPRQQPSGFQGDNEKQSHTPEEEHAGNAESHMSTSLGSNGEIDEKIFAIGSLFNPRTIPCVKDRFLHGGSGRRTRTRAGAHIGRQIASRIAYGTDDLAIAATLRAAAPFQVERRRSADAPFVINPADYRMKVREKRIGNYLIFVVDASGSMGARQRMIATKGAIQSLLLDTYRKRDKVAMVAFRKNDAQLVLPPGNSIVYASRLLSEMPTGGRTPLTKGLLKGYETARNCLLRNQAGRPVVMVITDGRANAPLHEGAVPIDEAFACAKNVRCDERISWIVIDTEAPGDMTFGLGRELAAALDAHYFRIEDLRAEQLTAIAKEFIYA